MRRMVKKTMDYIPRERGKISRNRLHRTHGKPTLKIRLAYTMYSLSKMEMLEYNISKRFCNVKD